MTFLLGFTQMTLPWQEGLLKIIQQIKTFKTEDNCCLQLAIAGHEEVNTIQEVYSKGRLTSTLRTCTISGSLEVLENISNALTAQNHSTAMQDARIMRNCILARH